ncbi:hypothetical protein AB838_01130 [Rhodobacteraceae bacterium (ex Bugula neritina AB1)]|nr:hypothetical protein AB838_01130 [Rhodobacteraceae bacterium (ex Bugula neritina AB1)]
MRDSRHLLLVNVFFAPFSYGGATVVAEQVAQALVRQGGTRITAVSLISRTDLAPYTVIRTEQSGIPNYLINVPAGRGYAEIYDNPEVTAVVARLMDQLTPDLMHVHCIQDIGAGIFQAARDRALPTILSVHDFWWICDRQFMIRVDQSYCAQSPVRIENCRSCVEDFDAAKARFDRLGHLGTLADLVTYPSRFARDLSEASGFAPGKGVVWENGVRLPGAGFFEAQAARRKNDPRLSFGFVGGPSQIKGWPVIRRAFASLTREDFRGLAVEGSLDGSWWAGHDLSDLPGDWQIHPRFSQNEMDDFYAQIDVLLFMSQWKETFGLAIREALARGIRVIQTDSGGTTEHGTVPAEDLIPIGAGPDVLRRQLEATLATHPAPMAPHDVASFDDQARAFTGLMDQIN